MFKKKKHDAAAPEGEEGAAPEKEADAVEGAEGEEGEGGHPKKGKRKLIMIAGALVVILIGAGLFFSGVLGGAKHEADKPVADEKAAAAAVAANAPVYYELPEFLVNLNSGTGHVSFLKMSVTLELRDKLAVATMDANKPRVVDTFNTYLRELRPSDIQGSAGIYRLRTELMARLNSTIEEGIVKDILFGEIIVQ